jgi:predicted MFS family arabinose efflux permease
LSWALILAVSVPIAALGLYAGTLADSYAALAVSVAVSGGAFAAVYAVGTTILGDTSNPGRWYGIKIAAEALTGALLLLVLPSTAIARWGFDGTVFGLIIIMIFLCPFLFWIPARGIKSPESMVVSVDVPEPAGHGQERQSHFIWGAILATLVFFSGASAVWAFLERIGAQAGHDPATVGVLLAVTLVFAVIGSLVAAVLGGRFGNVRPFLAGAAAFLAALALLGEAESFQLYVLGACTATFAIGFLLPIAVTEIAELDVDGRYVVLSVPAIGIGAMTGPGVAGVITQSGGYGPILVFGAVTIIIASILLAAAAGRARPSSSAPIDSGT